MAGKSTDGLRGDFKSRIDALLAASGGRVTLTSGFRSVERQAQLFRAAVAKYGSEKAARKYVAPPGKSNHNHGTAVDLGGDLAWVRANAARFGIYQPMSWEPWHWEAQGTRGGKTTPPDNHDGHQHGPGTPDAMDELEGKDPSWRTIEGQLANLMAAISSPTERVF